MSKYFHLYSLTLLQFFSHLVLFPFACLLLLLTPSSLTRLLQLCLVLLFHFQLLPPLFFFFFFKRLLTTHGNCSHASHLCLFLPPVHALCSGLFLCLSTCICLSVSTFCTQPFLAFRPWQPPSPLGVCSSGYIIYIRERCREEW